MSLMVVGRRSKTTLHAQSIKTFRNVIKILSSSKLLHANYFDALKNQIFIYFLVKLKL